MQERSSDTAHSEAAAYYREGKRLWREGRLEDAARALDAARRIKPRHPDILRNLGHLRLCLGQDEQGWADYEHRPERTTSVANSLGFPEWRGEDLEGKRLFVWPEQGLGDQIFAARYLPTLARITKVTLVCPPGLARLFSQLPVSIIPRTETVSVGPHYDFWALPLSLPRWVPPAPPPYLTAPARPSGRVGVAWRGNPLPDPDRSLTQPFAERLRNRPGAVSLHPEDTGAPDFQDTAEIISGLDRVVSIDTSVAHLAGALGKPTLVLLPRHSFDWRWRPKSPWYPSVATARQHAPGDWESVFDEVMAFIGPGAEARAR